MVVRVLRAILLLMTIVGFLFLPMSGILLYDDAMAEAIKDNVRVSTEKTEHSDYRSTDITAFTNDEYVFYIPPPSTKSLERPSNWYGYQYKSGQFIMANLSSLQIFAYENGAEVELEWLNATLIDKATFDANDQCWRLANDYKLYWLEDLIGPLETKKRVVLGEYETWETPLNNWVVKGDLRVLTGTIKITSDYPISVMHHKLCPTDSKYDNGDDKINYYWDGVYSAYCKKLFTRIARDCWISALEADTTVKVWDYSDKNDETSFQLDRFEGWSYVCNPIYEQYGFDDDLVLIAADKPISIVAGLQSDQMFLQVYGKDGKDFHFPCFGKVMIQAPQGATIELDDPNGNQGSFEGTLREGEIRTFDFKVIYKLMGYSSFEWATLRSNKPITVFTIAENQWTLDEDEKGLMAGEEYIMKDKKTTVFYPQGSFPYPADDHFKIPLQSKAHVTIVNLGSDKNDVTVEFSELKAPVVKGGPLKTLPFRTQMKPYQTVTMEFSEDSYYYMDMVLSDTGLWQPPLWTIRDPDNRYMLDSVPRIAVDRNDRDEVRLTKENITKGSMLDVKSEKDVMVFINYDEDHVWEAQGIELIPGLTPPTYRGMPDLIAIIVALSGAIIILDMLIVGSGMKSISDFYSRDRAVDAPSVRTVKPSPKPVPKPAPKPPAKPAVKKDLAKNVERSIDDLLNEKSGQGSN
jgi:hypothetical protein